jgi:hypothetical protein
MLMQLGMVENILIAILVYLKATIKRMSFLTVPTQSTQKVLFSLD